MKCHGRSEAALTLLEVIIVIAVIVVVIGMILPRLAMPHSPSTEKACINNLKQIGLAFRIFATDNDGKFPWQVSTNAGGSREYLDAPNSVFRHFQSVSNELYVARLLVCPKDKQRTVATNWVIDARHVSYFVGLNAIETEPSSLLSGDRNLMTNGAAVGRGLIELTTNWTVGWTTQLHKNAGNLLFGDGHVDQLSNGRLQQALTDSGVATNRLLIP